MLLVCRWATLTGLSELQKKKKKEKKRGGGRRGGEKDKIGRKCVAGASRGSGYDQDPLHTCMKFSKN